jgi:alpha-mannosidase
MLRTIEYVCTLASIKDGKYKYPKKTIDFMWEGVLLCQFHDCLPGSSIEMCYDDSDKVKQLSLALLADSCSCTKRSSRKEKRSSTKLCKLWDSVPKTLRLTPWR